MDVNVINAFLTAGMDVFNHMFGIECTHNEPYLMDIKIGHQWEVSGLLGITGECKGVVAFRLHKNLSKKMLERSGIYCKPEEADDMAGAAGNDLCAIHDGGGRTGELEREYGH